MMKGGRGRREGGKEGSIQEEANEREKGWGKKQQREQYSRKEDVRQGGREGGGGGHRAEIMSGWRVKKKRLS